jgi:hypothetical protein
MDTSESRSDMTRDERDAAPAGSPPVERADNGEPVLDPDADEDEAGRQAGAAVEHLEHHHRGHDDGEPAS